MKDDECEFATAATQVIDSVFIESVKRVEPKNKEIPFPHSLFLTVASEELKRLYSDWYFYSSNSREDLQEIGERKKEQFYALIEKNYGFYIKAMMRNNYPYCVRVCKGWIVQVVSLYVVQQYN